MSVIQRLTPTNLLEEKEKFFADNSYNPQFIYGDDTSDINLTKFGVPQPQLLEKAKNILQKTFHNRNEQDILMMEGQELNQHQVEKKIVSFLKMHSLDKRFKISWSASYVSRTSIDKNTIRLRLPVTFRTYNLLGMLYHEIGTHALRRVNYEKQVWFKQKKKYGLTHNYLATEEGLAVLHSLIPQPFKLAYKAARYYLATSFAQENSFSESWKLMTPYIQDPEKRWTTVLRQKRGLTDTSLPGGYTKDLVYFSGMIAVQKWLEDNSFDCTQLYIGKVALEDLEKAKKIGSNHDLTLPSFFSLNKEDYQKRIQEIINSN